MQFFAKNISGRGRWIRALASALLWTAAALTFPWQPALAMGFGVCGAFVLFEALRGWCILRACGIKTRF